MRWFKHDCDMHTDLKIQALYSKHGCEGYTVWIICLELLGKEGKSGRIDSKIGWQNGLSKVLGWSDNGKLKEILTTMAELNLISANSLKFGHLCIPKFVKRADEYTMKKLRTISGQTLDNIHVDIEQIKIIRTEYIKLAGFKEEDLRPDDYGRYGKAIKSLLIKADMKTNLVIDGLHWIANKPYSWVLETLIKKWPEFMKWNGMGEIERKYGKHEQRR